MTQSVPPDVPILIDTNVLLRFSEPGNRDGSFASAAIKEFTRLQTPLYYCSQNIGEFWNTATRPRQRNGFGLTASQALTRVLEIEDSFDFLSDGLEVHREWIRLLARYAVSGTKVYDAHLVATMIVHSVPRILTFNTVDFARYDEIRAVHPEEIASPPLEPPFTTLR